MTVTYKNRKGQAVEETQPVVLNPEQLNRLAVLHPTVEEAAAYFSVSVSSMYRKLREPVYREAWDQGYDFGNLSLRRKQRSVAMGGNVAMLIWLGKQYLKQADKAHVMVGDDRNLDPSLLGREFVTIPWSDDIDKELRAVDKLIEAVPGVDYDET